MTIPDWSRSFRGDGPRSALRFQLCLVCSHDRRMHGAQPAFCYCSDDGLTPVVGTATYGGRPMETGTTTFLAPNSGSRSAAATIKNGKYAVKVALGRKQVKIDGFRVLGQQHVFPKDPSSPRVDVQEKILPEGHNANGKLTREITENVGEYDFALEKRSAIAAVKTAGRPIPPCDVSSQNPTHPPEAPAGLRRSRCRKFESSSRKSS